MQFTLATKKEMSQVFAEDGTVIPVTVLQAGPVMVTQVKTVEKDGYSAVQVGFGTRKEKKISKPVRGHLKGLRGFRSLQEFRVGEDASFERGQEITVEGFEAGQKVDVQGVTIGRGFAGVVKRHNFKGGPASHGHKDQNRMPGSIGATGPQKVFKGVRMGGQMGNKNSTVKNLEVIEVDAANNTIKVKGAVPGANGAVLRIQTAKTS